MARMAPYHGQAAVRRARNLVGHSYGVGWCQMFTNQLFATGSVGDWDGDGSADAEDGWKKAVAHGKVVRASNISSYYNIPASVMLFWTGGSHGHGHAAVGVGGGKMVSTDQPRSGRIGLVEISRVRATWGLRLAGYATVDGNGYDLGSYGGRLGTAKPAAPGHNYRVSTRAGLYARRSPNGAYVTRGGQKLIRPNGFTIRVVKTAKAGGRVWAQGSGGLWYASKYLRRA
jgi:hypothetical protein